MISPDLLQKVAMIVDPNAGWERRSLRKMSVRFEKAQSLAFEKAAMIISLFQPIGQDDQRDDISVLAERFWSVHPREIVAMNISRQEFYEREMRALFEGLARK